MENNRGSLLMIVVCIVLLFIGAFRKKTEWLLNLVMRSILGTLAIYFINEALGMAGISLGIGINAVTILTSGILGFPGLLALYGIAVYRML